MGDTREKRKKNSGRKSGRRDKRVGREGCSKPPRLKGCYRKQMLKFNGVDSLRVASTSLKFRG